MVGKFEAGLLSSLRNELTDVLDAIRNEKALADNIKAKLKAAVDAFAKYFA